jgi:hypothetical protein
MSVYTLDIDSSERDPILYPNPGDYVVELTNPIYDVKKISIASARIHASQFLINERNNIFDFVVHSTPETVVRVTLTPDNYNGKTLATELQTKVNNALGGNYLIDNIQFTYNNDKNEISITSVSSPAGGAYDFSFKFYDGVNGYLSNTATQGYTTPHDIIGLPASNVKSNTPSTGGVADLLITGSLNLQGPDALVIKISNGADELNKTVYSDTPFYTGKMLMCGDVINYSGSDDAVVHNFDSGSQNISKLRVQFFYSSNNRLIPYDFRNANHIIKLSIECTTDKLSRVPFKEEVGAEVDRVEKYTLPPNIQIPDFGDLNKWDAFIYIFLIVLTGIMFIVMTKPKRLIE